MKIYGTEICLPKVLRLFDNVDLYILLCTNLRVFGGIKAHVDWCFWTVVLEKTLESPLDCQEIKPVHPKGNQSRIFIGKTDAESETPILWPPDAKIWFHGKDPDSGKDWRHEEKGTTEDEMASLTQWTWVWARSGSWWWTGKPGVLQSMELQSQTQLSNWTELSWWDCQSQIIYKLPLKAPF